MYIYLYYTLTTFFVQCIYTPSHCILHDMVNSRIFIMSVYMYYTLTCYVVQCIILFSQCILQDMVKRRIMSIYMYYTLTLNVVKCITLFYTVFYRTWSIEESLWTWWWQLPETRNTSSLFSSLHKTWGEHLLSNEHLRHVDYYFLILQIEERNSAP